MKFLRLKILATVSTASILTAMLYFDHNATTPVLPEARAAWLDACEKFTGNPSSLHRLGQRADAALNSAREQLAAFLGCDAPDIVWTSGATESNNLVFHHLARTVLRAGGGSGDEEVWISAIEHPCVLAAAAHYFPGRAHRIPVTGDGVVEVGWIRRELRKRNPSVIAVMAANNETGVLQPWREVQSLAVEREVPFFCDAAQWLGKLPARGLGACDFVSGCAHKFGGPKGAGFLKCPGRGRVHPLLLGGKQEEGRRAGTENVPGVIAMLAALQARESLIGQGGAKERLEWRGHFERNLLKKLPGAEIVGAGSERLWNTVSALMPEADCRQRWVVKLDKFGCAVSTGSACASGREEASHVLAAMNYGEAEAARVLRFSSGWETTGADWALLMDGLLQVQAEVGGEVRTRKRSKSR